MKRNEEAPDTENVQSLLERAQSILVMAASRTVVNSGSEFRVRSLITLISKAIEEEKAK